MTDKGDAKLVLRKNLKALHSGPIEVNGYPIGIKIAGVAVEFNAMETPDMKKFMKALSASLTDQASRVKNIQSLM